MRFSLLHAHVTTIASAAVATMLSACTTARPSYNDEMTPHAMYATDGPVGPRTKRLAEFEERRRVGQGRFLTAEVLSANDDIQLADLLRLRIPGFANARDGRFSALEQKACMHVYLNGLSSPNALESLHAHDLMGVEFYDATTAPQQYRPSLSSCPVLLLWTK